MAHGYLGEGYGSHGEIDPDRGEPDRDDDRNWRGARAWRDRDETWRGPGGNSDRAVFGGYDDERMSQRQSGDRWPRRDSSTSIEGPGEGELSYDRSRGRGLFGASSNFETGERRYSANPDDHYRSWRDRQMNSLDEDYADYCREREQQFHRDFDQWRRDRQGSTTQAEIAVAADEERAHERALSGEDSTPSPIDAATLGTNNSENRTPGRARTRS